MLLQKSKDIFQISVGGTVSKRNLFDLIQYSKVEGSPFWAGTDFVIGNTPQQGINWIGMPPHIQGVIIKTRPGSYQHDGWLNDDRHTYRYSFKARNSVISYSELANRVLILQPQFLYPILLFTEVKGGWSFEGQFSVTEIDEMHVTLQRQGTHVRLEAATEESEFVEGGLRYVTHLIAERNRAIVSLLKSKMPSVCEICEQDFSSRYGVNYIEAHHKTPISTFTSRRSVTARDFALLCPNCHKAVHIYMKRGNNEYHDIRDRIRSKLLT
ncbi:restriction endonuclease [Agrobacterium rhizogenes]|uniref:HNH endonuclease n=1 Tax=Rhizobium rhizogenes TaxID=359 RepID=UPI001572A2C5|nr:HNH endonuclease [Rhizobium rhizogenes]NTI62371.1 restriction endonuclease [Rhizobium rhizogenes]